MKNRSPVRSAQAIVPAELFFLIGLLIPGSVALSQPFPSFMLDSTSHTRMPDFDEVDGTAVALGHGQALDPPLGLSNSDT